MTDYTQDELLFAIFCIECLADKEKKSGQEVYNELKSGEDILDNYIIKNYDVLHTQGEEYLVSDIQERLNRRQHND